MDFDCSIILFRLKLNKIRVHTVGGVDVSYEVENVEDEDKGQEDEEVEVDDDRIVEVEAVEVTGSGGG